MNQERFNEMIEQGRLVIVLSRNPKGFWNKRITIDGVHKHMAVLTQEWEITMKELVTMRDKADQEYGFSVAAGVTTDKTKQELEKVNKAIDLTKHHLSMVESRRQGCIAQLKELGAERDNYNAKLAVMALSKLALENSLKGQ